MNGLPRIEATQDTKALTPQPLKATVPCQKVTSLQIRLLPSLIGWRTSHNTQSADIDRSCSLVS